MLPENIPVTGRLLLLNVPFGLRTSPMAILPPAHAFHEPLIRLKFTGRWAVPMFAAEFKIFTAPFWTVTPARMVPVPSASVKFPCTWLPAMTVTSPER